MKTFLTADWHLGETRLDILGRPFANTVAMAYEILRNYRSVIKDDDELIHVGDVAYDPEWLFWVGEFPGRKTLIRGNHDRKLSNEQLGKYFEKIVEEGDGIEMEIAGLPLYITHYPTCGRPDRFNLVAHVHASWKFQKNMLNVGVDVHHFRPMNIEEVPFYVNAITNFYDDDVWCANHVANATHYDRGKKGSYF